MSRSEDFKVLKDCTVITERDPRLDDPQFAHETPLQLDGVRKDVIYLDEEVAPAFFYNEYMWHLPGSAGKQTETELKAAAPHTSPYDKVISFAGSNPDNLYDLCGSVEVVLNGQVFDLTRCFAVYIPAGMVHSVTVKKVDRPIWQYVLGHGKRYIAEPAQMPEADPSVDLEKQFSFSYGQGFDLPDYRKGGGPNDTPGRHDHIMLMNEQMVPEAEFYIEESWLGPGPRAKLPPGVKHAGPKRHVHPFPELITYFGTNWDDLYDLNGHVYITLEDIEFDITQTFVVYIPENVPHCPLYLEEIPNRMIHFTAGPVGVYV